MKKLGIIYAPRLSASAAALAAAVPLYRVGPDGFNSTAGKKACTVLRVPIINWGSTKEMAGYNRPMQQALLNHGGAVRTATSKLKTLTILKEASIPALEATREASVAKQWLAEGTLVLARKDGLSGGQGITKLESGTQYFNQKGQVHDFFVKYWKKTHEYRVHVFNGQVIDIQQKRRRTEWTGNYDPMIRNFDNGWVFCHDNLRGTQAELATIGTTACSAVDALGLDFGAVDVLARFKENGALSKHVVCEINTAPGLEGQTLDKYVQAIRGYLNGI